MSIRAWAKDRFGSKAVDDPDDPIELVTVAMWRAPLLLVALEDEGIEARGVEAYNIVTRTLVDTRIIVRRRDFEAADAVVRGLASDPGD